ncbi:aspartate ammonia-lyase [Brevibacillus nitrificans]|uniref:aspartate ammonia-lyase n=1 Tax=Brevibacillus nitrificans TaxID=651560 RepID=UPI0026080D67|nr:aspartate ammonia-lyase [Brevibacillus nitrificans]MED1793555.1 aspartate ammonia-lyase [Brevibacillus nitrificans]
MMRTEHDGLGEMQVPDELYYGIQTMRSLQLSPVSHRTIGEDAFTLVKYLAAIKKAAALANCQIGSMEERVSGAICQAAEEVMQGNWTSCFVVDMFQGGGGIATHMNVNEVIANRANELLTGERGYSMVHPNTHVNMGQSTNDVLPSAMKLSLYEKAEALITQVESLREAWLTKAEEYADVVKLGRTCLQDALPVTLGQEFGGYASMLHRQIRYLREVQKECLHLPLGATAVGTGVGLLPGFLPASYRHLQEITGWELHTEDNLFDGLQYADVYLRMSAVLKSLATGISKMSRDLRIMSSGPNGGLNEIELPSVQPGSSIMPGKVNPILPELMIQVSYQVCGNDYAVTVAAEGGELDLNVWESLIVKCLFESFTLLTESIPLFASKCVSGIRANRDVCRSHAETSTAVAAVIATIFGYETGSDVAKLAIREQKTVKQVVVESGLITAQEAEWLLDPVNLTDPKRLDDVLVRVRQK